MNKLINNAKALLLTLVSCVIAVTACTLEDDVETLWAKVKSEQSNEETKTGKAILELSHNNKVIGNDNPVPVDFGDVELTTNKSLLFTITNVGESPLILNGTPVILSSNDAFAIPAQPTNTSIAPGASVSFLVLYTPTAEKADNGTITIMNNSDALIFTLNIKGTGYVKRPQITVRQDSTTINLSGEYNFNKVVLGKYKDITFTIGNSGDAPLVFETVNDNSVNLENNAGNIFTVIAQPTSTTVSPGGTTTFSIRFNPAATGSNLNATVRIRTNSRVRQNFSFRVKGDSVLEAPSGVTAVSQQANSMLLSWNPVQGAASYKVYYGTSSSAITILAGSAVTETSYTHTGLSAGTTYYYCITANDNTSESDRSQAVSMITLPGIPANLRSTASTYNSITIAWSTVTGAASYNIYFAASAEGSKTFVVTRSGTTSYTHTSLSADTTYYYFVTAVNSTGEGAYTEALTVKTLIAPLSAPGNVTATALSTSSIQVTWDAVAGAANYKVYRAISSTGAKTLLDTVTTTSYTSGGLTERTYWYFVTALNANNVESALSSSASMIPKPSAPVISGYSSGSNSITLRWDYKNGYSYKIYFATSLTGAKTLAGTSTSDSYTHSGLQSNTTYYYWLIAVNVGGESEYSSSKSAATTPAPPAAPTNLRQTASTSTTVTLAWNAVSGATRYDILLPLNGSTGASYLSLGSVTTTSITITNLSPNTTYLFIVRAYNVNTGLTGPEAEVSGTTSR